MKYLDGNGLVYVWGKIVDLFNSKQEVIDTVNATIDSNVGVPQVLVNFNEGELDFTFKNLKGQTGAIGPIGPQGPRGISAVFDPNTGNILAELENTTGNSVVNAMTQKAVTDELNDIRQTIVRQEFLTEADYEYLVNNDMVEENVLYNIYE